MNKVTMLELILLSVAVTVSTSIMFTPYLVAQVAGQNAWISVLAAGLAAAIPAWAAGKIITRYPNKSLVQVLSSLFGSILGKLIAVILSGYFLFAAILAVWRLEVFSLRFLLLETPVTALRILILASVAWAAFSGAIPLIRTSAYIVPAGMLVIFLVIGLPVAEMDPKFFTPILAEGFQPVLTGGGLLLGYLCQVPLVIMVFQRYVKDKFARNCARKVTLGVFIATLALEMGATGTLAVFGPEQTATMYYPAFELARVVSIGYFLEHLEVAFISVWIVGILITAAFYIQAFADSLSDLINIKGNAAKVWIYVSAVIVLFSWEYFVEDTSFLRLISIIRDYSARAVVVLGGILPLLMLVRVVVAVPRTEKDRIPEESGPEQDDNSGKGEKREGKDKDQGIKDKEQNKLVKSDTQDTEE